MFPQSIGQLAHATIITGDREHNLKKFKEFLQDQHIVWQGNPDVAFFVSDQLVIDTAREIISSVSAQKFSEVRFVIISFDRATIEAQNTLLKSLEEPAVGTYFVLFVPTSDQVLPTIVSRCQIRAGAAGAGASRLDTKPFLAGTLADRFVLVESWTRNKKDEDNLSKSEVIAFIEHLEQVIWSNRDGIKITPGQDLETLFADIRSMHHYASIRGASHRVILDYLAMIAPRI